MSEVYNDIEIPNGLQVSLIKGFQNGIMPDPILTVSEWADSKRILSDLSAEPGRFKTSRTPYLREIQDKLSVNDPAQEIIFMKGSQIGATESGNNWVGYSIDIAPAPFIYIMPTDAMMKKTSKQRIEKMLESTPELRTKTPKVRAKDSVNTILYKEFPGMFISMVGANSPVGLASTPARNIYGDEIDRYPQSVGGEGSAIDLARTRTATFGNRRKVYLTSTPTVKGTSQIESEFEKTDQRYFHVACPCCNEYQVFSFDQLRYEKGKYSEVTYECIACNERVDEYSFKRNMEHGKWIPKHPENSDGYTFGYHLSAMYSPYGMYSWSKMAKDYEESRGKPAKEIVFTNTKLGESYEAVSGDKPDWENILDRAEDYDQGIAFASVAFITAGVDVQADRLEIEIVGWIKGKTSQSIEYIQLIGDTSQAEVWADLGKILMKTWVRQGDNAIIPLRLMGLDTGYNTTKAYEFAQKHGTSRVIPMKGMAKLSMYFSAPKAVDIQKAGKKIGKVNVWGIGVSIIKTDVYGSLKLRVDSEAGVVPDGYCYFPKREPSYFRGLTAEEVIQVDNKKGYPELIWYKKYKRNEPLDCRVYARAAAAIAGMDRWDAARWNRESNMHDIMQDVQQKIPAAKKKKKERGSDFW